MTGRPSESTDKICKNCGELYPVKPSRKYRSKFCGEECKKEYNDMFSKKTLKYEIIQLRDEVSQLREKLEEKLNRDKLARPEFEGE